MASALRAFVPENGDQLLPEYEQTPKYLRTQRQADSYIARAKNGKQMFPGSHLTGKMYADAQARQEAEQQPVVPLDLALAQAQLESKMGTAGRNPETNPYNVGEFDTGTMQHFQTPDQGVQAYYKLMGRDYLPNPNLLNNFVNKNGNRYASNPAYEQQLRQQVPVVRRTIDKVQ